MWFYQTLISLLKASIQRRSNKRQYRRHVQKRKVLNRCKIDAVVSYLHQANMFHTVEKYNETLFIWNDVGYLVLLDIC